MAKIGNTNWGLHSDEDFTSKVDDLVSVFQVQNCYVKNTALLKDKLRKLLEGGKDSVQVLSDFDRTLTKAQHNGTHCDVSYGVLKNSKYTSKDIQEELKSLEGKYHPIEMCSSMNNEDKIPYMVKWWDASINLGTKSTINRSQIPEMVKESSVVLRDGVGEFFRVITEHDIPLLVVSAGLGDFIEEILRQQSKVPPQLTLLANFYTFDANGVVEGRAGDLLHTFNKHLISKLNHVYFESITKRTNAIVLGDTLGDPHMADGIEHLTSVFKIGFLNGDVSTSLTKYLSVYDVVLTHDANMMTINAFLHILLTEN